MRFLAQLVNGTQIPHVSADSGTLQKGFVIFYQIVGAVGLLLLIIGALRYMIAGGDANKVAESKRMIAYTLIGLVVIALAGTIVEFVLKAKP